MNLNKLLKIIQTALEVDKKFGELDVLILDADEGNYLILQEVTVSKGRLVMESNYKHRTE